MNAQELRAAFEDWFKAINVRDVATLDKLADKIYTSDCSFHDPGLPNLEKGPTGAKSFVRQLFHDWQEVSMTLEDMLIDGDKLACRITVRGIMVATGDSLILMVLSVSHIVDGKIAEDWELAVPTTEK